MAGKKEEYKPWVSEKFLENVAGALFEPLTNAYNGGDWRYLGEIGGLLQECGESLRRADNVKNGFDEAGTDRLA